MRSKPTRWTFVLSSAFLVLGLTSCADPLTRIVTQESAPPGITITSADNNTLIELQLGQSAFIEDLGIPLDDAYIESDDTAVVFPVQPGDAQGAAGLLAVGEGPARVSVWETFPTNQNQVPVLTLRVVVKESQE